MYIKQICHFKRCGNCIRLKTFLNDIAFRQIKNTCTFNKFNMYFWNVFVHWNERIKSSCVYIF